MTFASARGFTLMLAVAALSTSAALAAPQPIIVGPYPILQQTLYDVDYAVSSLAANSPQGIGADTIISIGLPSKVNVVGCQAQVDWFDWDGTPAGLSGPGNLPTGAPNLLVPGHTLEYTTSSNANPNNYPHYQENVFRDKTTPFEGYAQVRIQCPTLVSLAALRIDAQFLTTNPSGKTGFPPGIKSKTINVTKTAGLVGY
jgi:hypothetical protein